jgi:polysaccharide biosynthesis/export protein
MAGAPDVPKGDTMIRRFLPLPIAALLLAACATAQPDEPRLAQVSLDDYTLDSGDKVRVTVFGQTDLSGEFNVDSGGRVALPYLEPVEARGKTTVEFARNLEESLRQTLLRNPSVSVEITLYRPFFILGEVMRPGQYSFVNGMTVKTAAAIAGGFTYRASMSRVAITRQAGGETLEGRASIDAQVMPGDTIVIAERIF